MPKIKTVRGIENRKVVSQKEWLVARKKLLLNEKKFSKLRDELNLQRRNLPWVKIEKNYVFDGPSPRRSTAGSRSGRGFGPASGPTGKGTLDELFEGKNQQI